MQALTLLIAIPSMFLCAVLQPAYAACVFFAALFGWSQWLTVPIAGLNFTTGRLVIIGLVINALRRNGFRIPFRWKAIDTWILLTYLGGEFALLHSTDVNIVLVREGGAFFDTVLVYFVVRSLIKTREELIILIKGWILIGSILGLMGMYQAATGVNPMGFMAAGYSYGLANADPHYQMRMGFYRANVTVGVSISFGLLLAALACVAIGLWRRRVLPKPVFFLACGVLVVGAMSSMSSAPYLAVTLGLAFIAGFPLRRYWIPIAAAILTCILFVQVYSNRNFYEVLTIFSFDESSAYYRTELIKECFHGGMTGHWLFGYGYVGYGPGCDNSNFHWVHIDLCNLYIGLLASRGLFGCVPYLIVNFLYFRMLYVAAKKARNVEDQWLIWCISAALASWNLAMMTVSAMNQVTMMLYAMMGISASLPEMVVAGRQSINPRVLLQWRRLLLQKALARTAAADA